MLVGKDLLEDIEEDIDALERDYNHSDVVDLKLKYAILLELQDIHTQLFEISHYGIGTD